MNWESKILSLTYGDTMEIYRQQPSIDDDTGIVGVESEIKLYSSIPCALSKFGDDKASNTIETSYKIFCNADIIVTAKDKIIVTHQGQKYRVIAGVPFYYPSHVEIIAENLERI